MPRIQPLAPPYPSALAETLASMMPPGVEPLLLFRTLARSPRILEKVRAGNLLDRGPLDRADRELVILRTCARCGSEYEWGVHAAVFAHRVGLDDAHVRGSVHAGPEDPRFSERQRALLRLVDELHARARVSDSTWRRLALHFDEPQLLELLLLVGFYHTISFVTNALEIDLEPAGSLFPDRDAEPDPPRTAQDSPAEGTSAGPSEEASWTGSSKAS